MATQEKIAAVSELKELFEASNAVILTEYRGLTVTQLKELRRALGAETEYAVVKNTLACYRQLRSWHRRIRRPPPGSLRTGIHQGRPD